MRLTSFQLKNYKSYIDSGEMMFAPGINVVVGQNNAGKSALMETLVASFTTARPHRSLATKRDSTTVLNPVSSKRFTIEVTGSELRNILLAHAGQFAVPVSKGQPGSEKYGRVLLDDLVQRKAIRFPLVLDTHTGLLPQKLPSFDDFQSEQAALFSASADRSHFRWHTSVALNPAQELGVVVGAAFTSNSYTFKAERYNVAESGFGVNSQLSSDARNLPEVLNVLQGSNPARFRRLNELVSQIFPTVKRITVRPNTANTTLQICVWTNHPDLERDDLAIPLDECGTGLGQVLAILYVTINSSIARTIVIDEPNTFLHPGAVRTLIEILRSFPLQQFIISTHSSEVIRAAQPSTLCIIRWSDGVTSVEPLEPSSLNDVRSMLREVGASIGDVFGSERILWVEGQTEEDCFGVIIDKVLRRPLIGTAIVAVRDTGAFESKRRDAKTIWEIYARLSHAQALLPPALAFSFDREGRTEEQMNDLVRQSKGQVFFLPRRMLENYVLDSDAIAAVLNRLPSFADNAVSPRAISEWINSDREAIASRGGSSRVDEQVRLQTIDGASVLRRLFQYFSGAREEFRKTEHVPALVAWLAENKPDSLEELASYIDRLLTAKPAS